MVRPNPPHVASLRPAQPSQKYPNVVQQHVGRYRPYIRQAILLACSTDPVHQSEGSPGSSPHRQDSVPLALFTLVSTTQHDGKSKTYGTTTTRSYSSPLPN